jgi:hypothetical protein
MFKSLTPILSIILLAGQSLYLPVRSDSCAKPSEVLVALVQPQSSDLTTNKAAFEQETRSIEEQNHVIPGVVIYAHNFGGDEANMLAQDGVLIGTKSADKYIDLQSGNVLLTPEKDIVVETNKGKISIAAGAMVFVSASSDDVVVYDLLQTKPKQVSMIVNKQKLDIEPGRMLVITIKDTSDFEKLDIHCHYVACRSVVSVELNSTAIKAFMAEFSIASAMVAIEPLKELTVSGNQQDKLVMEKLVKGAVLLGDFAASPVIPEQVATAQSTVQVADVGGNQ